MCYNFVSKQIQKTKQHREDEGRGLNCSQLKLMLRIPDGQMKRDQTSAKRMSETTSLTKIKMAHERAAHHY